MPSSEQLAEELEEAEFYYQQDLHDEAEAVYRRILKVAPEHPAVLERLAELAAARGEDPAQATASAAPPNRKKAAEPPEQKAPVQDAAEEPASVEGSDSDDSEDHTEVAEVSIDLDDEQPAVQIDPPPAVRPGDVSAKGGGDARGESSTQDLKAGGAEAAAPEAVAASAESSEDSGHFDLAAELRDVLEGDDDGRSGDAAGSVKSTVEEGFESIFADFKQGVSATVSEDDYETRYDLGIAYREMELYEDAIGEFRLCLESTSRKVGSLHMMGLCALDLGRTQDAANHLEQALATPDLAEEQRAGLLFDLGRAFEASGDVDRARSSYEAATETDPDFPGIQERLEALTRGGAGGGSGQAGDGGGAEGFESFDDLVADANKVEEEEPESFESFDDVIAEADGEPAVEEPEAGDVKASKSKSKSTRKKKKKKKISFV
jgi:tetratricopeptide (TPR) repeat protein